MKPQLCFKCRAGGNRCLPELTTSSFFFRTQPHCFVPSPPLAKSLIAPLLIYVGQLPIVVRGPNGTRQRVGQLPESGFTQFHRLFRPFETDGHERIAKFPCRFNLHFSPRRTSSADHFLPHSE